MREVAELSAPGPEEPWFRRRPGLSVAVAIALFATILVLRLSFGTVVDALSMLFCLPIALLAVTLGFRAGLLSGLVGVALIGIWAAADHIELSALGWIARVVPLLLLGALLGQATDRLAVTETERRRLENAALRHREAIEINDSIVQGLAAAKWSLESGNVERGLEVINDTLETAQAIVSGLLRDADALDVGPPPRRSLLARSLQRRRA